MKQTGALLGIALYMLYCIAMLPLVATIAIIAMLSKAMRDAFSQGSRHTTRSPLRRVY